MPTRRAALAALTVIAAALLAPAATATPPTDPQCAALAAGTTGVLVAGGQVPSPEQLQGRRGGFGAVAPPAVARTLPDVIAFKTPTQTFTLEDAFVLRSGHVYVRPARVGRTDPREPWHRLELPSCLDGHVRTLSGDGRLLLALTEDGQLYSHDMPGGDLSPERWTWRWGPYFWTGTGMRVFPDVRTIAASELTSGEHFTDSSGRERTPLGVATVYLLRGDRRTITYLDPWLPTDDSREVCGPDRGTRRLAALSGSGSTVFVAAEDGSLWTRLYDFDVSGANTVMGSYSWQTGRPASDTAWQLPSRDWRRQPAPPGEVTDRVLIAKTGLASTDRLLRVEGRDRTGRHGWWEKGIAAASWRFVPRPGPLAGRVLSAPVERVGRPGLRYVGTIGGARVTVPDFDPVCSPERLHVEVAPGVALDLVLHTVDGLRQETRAKGLDDTPRDYAAAVEVPRALWDRLAQQDPRVRAWIGANLSGRITVAPFAATATRLRFVDQCWQLTLDGRPARPDVPRVPADLGAAVGRATEQRQDGMTPALCPPSP